MTKTIEEQLKSLREETLASLKQLKAENQKELQDLRVAVLGKKGSLTEVLKGMKDISAEMRPIIGKHVNEARDILTAAFEKTAQEMEEQLVALKLAEESLDVTLPGCHIPLGSRHILSQTSEEIEDIFIGMGYQVVDGFEVEKDYYNFEDESAKGSPGTGYAGHFLHYRGDPAQNPHQSGAGASYGCP